jgi:hypothetical protein
MLWLPALALAALPLAALGGGGPDPVDPLPRIEVGYDQAMHFGVSVIRNKVGKPIAQKLLTFSPTGGTNSTMLRIAGRDIELGDASGKWLERGVKMKNVPGFGEGTHSVYRHGAIEVHQNLRIIPSSHGVEVSRGEFRRLLDTVRVDYALYNKGGKAHKVGLRVMIDTLIGQNDGVPFTVPGSAGLVNTSADFTDPDDVPDFIEALERPNLNSPGTVAHLSLRTSRLETPSRVTLTHWMGAPPWDVPVRNIGSDSAVVMYWPEKALAPGARRLVGFAYGLGHVRAAPEGKGNMGVTVGGSFEENVPFTVTAYITNPAPGQMVELVLPDGLRLVRASRAKVTVPRPKGDKNISVVTWRVEPTRRGGYTLRVQSSTGPALARVITITEKQSGS